MGKVLSVKWRRVHYWIETVLFGFSDTYIKSNIKPLSMLIYNKWKNRYSLDI